MSERDLATVLGMVVPLAAAAGRLQLDRRGAATGITTKAHVNDLVSQVDIASEKLIVDGILAAFPDDSIVVEEGSDITGGSDWRWVIDPLDGTRNYLAGAGPWSVSIALQHGAHTVVGVVHDPAAGETFSAIAGNGALLNDESIRVSTVDVLAESIISLSFNPSPPTKLRLAALLAELLPLVGDIRRVPSALGLSYLAAGRFDGCLILDAQPWDIAAAELIAREAGATVATGAVPANELAVCAGAGLLSEFAELAFPLLGSARTLAP